MAILGLIFKIIGIVLLCVIGFALLLLLGILLVPLRYRGKIHYKEELQWDAGVSWLCHIVGIHAEKIEEEIKVSFCFLGFSKLLWSSERKDEDTFDFGGAEDDEEDEFEDFFITEDIKKEEAPRQANKIEMPKQDTAVSSEKKEALSEPEQASKEKVDEQGLSEKMPEPKEETISKNLQSEKKEFEEMQEEIPSEEKTEFAGQKNEREKMDAADAETQEKKVETHKKSNVSDTEKPSKKRKKAMQRWKKKTASFRTKWKNLKQKIAKGKQVITDEDNKEAVRLAWHEIRYLLHHYGPRSMKGEVCFSTGNPAWTGKLVAAISLFPIVYQKGFFARPDFVSEEAYLYGEVQIKGHLRMAHLVKTTICLLRSKAVRRAIKQIRG